MSKEKLMRKFFMAVIVVIVAIPACSFAQQSGAFVGSIGLGLTSAQDQFSDPKFFAAGSGFGAEAQVQYFLLNGFGVGGFVNYMRFGSSFSTAKGRTSFNFSQMGGVATLNLINFSNGAFYLTGGGGTFKPNAHFYMPDNSTDLPGSNRGYFGFGGIGLTSYPDRKVLYQLELKYNFERADYTLFDGAVIKSNVFDFIYFGMKLSFASKGKEPPPKY
jgi:hypothetical protein